ncbi:MAG TPA: tetratricopeptide repeat protein [Myxococcales bacterium]|nr:tetratricopeptide repeat protein [Myxococcales bacterium]
MRANVFTDAALKRHAGRFVWLSMNTERADAAPFLDKFPVEGWPTLFVIDPGAEKVALKWPGSATVPQLVRLLDDGERAVKGGGQGLEAKLTALDRAFGQGNNEEAARIGSELAAAPPDWPGRPRAVELWLSALSSLKQWDTCASAASAELDRLARGAPYADVTGMGLSCAQELPKDAAGRADRIDKLEKTAEQILEKRDIAMAGDDYSGLFLTVVGSHEARGDADGQKAWTQKWARYLEEAAAKASSPEARAVYDSHRMTAYGMLKQPEKSLPMLQASEKALPDDFNPPARLAAVYRDLGRYDEALAASERALARAQGPRRLRILSTKADILQKKGDVPSARKTLDDALAFAAALPKAQQYQSVIDSLQKKRAELDLH